MSVIVLRPSMYIDMHIYFYNKQFCVGGDVNKWKCWIILEFSYSFEESLCTFPWRLNETK